MLVLVLIGLGAGAAQTGATGLLLAAVPTARIVTAMVVWSQLGILGYLAAPASADSRPNTSATPPSACSPRPPPPCWPSSPLSDGVAERNAVGPNRPGPRPC
jgi:hypothetical protein